MKAVILAGGLGSRLSEETVSRPKPMVEIGGKPILWHIMKIYAAHGIDEFVICLGYKGYMIKEYFANYYLHTCDITFDLAGGDMEVHRSTAEPWKVTLVDTGEDTHDRRPAQTGARPTWRGRRISASPMATGVADLNLRRSSSSTAPVAASPPSPRSSLRGGSGRCGSTASAWTPSRRSRGATAAG